MSVERGAKTKLVVDRKTVAADQFVPFSGSGQGTVKARVVHAGHGVISKEHSVDDYAQLPYRFGQLKPAVVIKAEKVVAERGRYADSTPPETGVPG